MIELLEAFSTSPDKTKGLPDFEKMIVAGFRDERSIYSNHRPCPAYALLLLKQC
jgi:hypothetical protein